MVRGKKVTYVDRTSGKGIGKNRRGEYQIAIGNGRDILKGYSVDCNKIK